MELAELTDDRVNLLVSKQDRWYCDTNAGRLFDISCGNQTFIWGYNHWNILWAVHGITNKVSWVNYKASESTESVDLLANNITQESGLHSVAWAVSGTDAVELAFYLKDLYFKKHNPNRQEIICFAPGYSGTSLLPSILRGEFEVPWCHIVDTGIWPTIVARQHHENAALQQVEDLLKNNHNIGTVFMESIPWIEKLRPWSDSWWHEVRRLCDKYECLLIVDDVMGGYGKTGTRFTHNAQGILPDLVISGKSITGGYTPLSTVCMSEDITRSVSAKFGFSHTWSPNMAGVDAANWIWRHWPEETAFNNITSRFNSLITERLTKGHIKQGWHKGILCSVELVNPITQLKLLESGIMPSGLGCYYDNNHLTLCVPVGIEDNGYWDELNERLDNAFSNT